MRVSTSVQRTLAHLRAHDDDERCAAAERAGRLRERLGEAARVLRERYHATDVRLFGSLAWGEPSCKSDVDIAVEGVAPDQIVAATADLRELLDAFVDLVRMETIPAGLRARIEIDGARL